jgi:CheY-like chemotaxis protein
MEKAKRILIVEDNDFVRMQIVGFLQAEGYETTESPDGRDALAVIGKGFDAVIADIRMDPVDGFEFIKTIRSDGDKTPVILVTGDETTDLLNEATKLGVAAVLKKPVNKERLLKIISRTIGLERRTH